MYRAYLRAYARYLRTPKGRHDFFDYLRALVIFALVTALVMALIRLTVPK